MALPPRNSGRWTTGLCGCFEHFPSCCLGCWCPCILVGRSAEVIDQGATSCCSACCVFCLLESCTSCGCFYTCGYRGRLRAKFGLPESPCGDCLTDCCCLKCSICQVYRELLNRNIDPFLGYVGAKQTWEQPQAPPQQFMTS
ncbi:hypothetical protein R1flu_020015 [Riccia fluitans]|uniref:Uncharacterized protein n=1 Tax=Riccia fluitans TaxID=41844 RepID=A0ABD1ZKA7_9MARC